jgi:hypothetical protein
MIIQRKICISEKLDILCWGYTPTRTFTIKEGYHLQENFHNQPKDHLWNIIWKSKIWSKVSTFLWILVQNRILIWDNIKKRGFMGPSIWHLCHHSHHSHHSSHKASFKKHLLKLDVKFALPMFNGDANPENLDNWIR